MTPALRARVLREWQPYAADPVAAATRARPLDRLVPGVVQRLGLDERLRQSQVCQLWPRMVGPDIARHAQPVGLRQGTLLVNVDHPVWLQELSRFHKSLLLKKIAAVLGAATVKNISFRIG